MLEGALRKPNMAFFCSLALKGPLFLEYSRLQAHIIKYNSTSENWEDVKWIRIITSTNAFMKVLSI